jgi:hypothetical protein
MTTYVQHAKHHLAVGSCLLLLMAKFLGSYDAAVKNSLHAFSKFKKTHVTSPLRFQKAVHLLDFLREIFL